MAGNRRNKRRGSRRPKGRKGSKGSTTRMPSQQIRSYPTLRSFSFYPVQIKKTKDETPTWLESLKYWGSIAMQVFTTIAAVADDVSIETDSYAVTGSVQCMAIGVDDLVVRTPICETVTYKVKPIVNNGVPAVKSYTAPALDYRQGKICSLNVKITSSGELSKRAGRLAAALVPLTDMQAKDYSTFKPDVPSFKDLTRLPGAVTALAGTPISLNWRPHLTDFGYQMCAIGQEVNPDEDVDPMGGTPVVLLFVGYQDMASSSSDPAGLYAPEEALINVDVSSRLSLREYGRTWLRPLPIVGEKKIGIEHPTDGVIHRVEPGDFIFENGRLTCSRDIPSGVRQRFADFYAGSRGSVTSGPLDGLSLEKMAFD